MRNVNWESSKTDTIILLPSKRVQRTPVKVSTVDSRREFSVLEGNERRTSPRKRSALLLRRAKIRTLAHGVRYIPYVWPEERTHTSPILSCSLSRIQKLFLSMNLDDPNRSTARLVSWISSWEARRTRFVGARGVTGTRGIVKAMHCKELTTTIPSLRPSRVRARARAPTSLSFSRHRPFLSLLPSLPPSLPLTLPPFLAAASLSFPRSLSLSLSLSLLSESLDGTTSLTLSRSIARSLARLISRGGRVRALASHSSASFDSALPKFFSSIFLSNRNSNSLPFFESQCHRDRSYSLARSLACLSKGERERPKDSEVTTSGIQYYRFLSLVTLGPTWSSPRDPCRRRRRFRASRSFDLTRARL